MNSDLSSNNVPESGRNKIQLGLNGNYIFSDNLNGIDLSNFHCKNCNCHRETSRELGDLNHSSKNADIQETFANKSDVDVYIKSTSERNSGERVVIADYKSEELKVTTEERYDDYKTFSNNCVDEDLVASLQAEEQKHDNCSDESRFSLQECSESLLCEMPYLPKLVNSKDKVIASHIDTIDKTLSVSKSSFESKAITRKSNKGFQEYDLFDNEESCSQSLLKEVPQILPSQKKLIDVNCSWLSKSAENISSTLNFEESEMQKEKNSEHITNNYAFSKDRSTESESPIKSSKVLELEVQEKPSDILILNSQHENSDAEMFRKQKILDRKNSNSQKIIHISNKTETDFRYKTEDAHLFEICNFADYESDSSVIEIEKYDFESDENSTPVESSKETKRTSNLKVHKVESGIKENRLDEVVDTSPSLKNKKTSTRIAASDNEQKSVSSDTDNSSSDHFESFLNKVTSEKSFTKGKKIALAGSSSGEKSSESKIFKRESHSKADSLDKEISNLCRFPTLKRKRDDTKSESCSRKDLKSEEPQPPNNIQKSDEDISYELNDFERNYCNLKSNQINTKNSSMNSSKMEKTKPLKIKTKQFESDSCISIDSDSVNTPDDMILPTQKSHVKLANNIARELLLNDLSDESSESFCAYDDHSKAKKVKKSQKARTLGKTIHNHDVNGDPSDSENFESKKKSKKYHKLLKFSLSDKESDESHKQNISESRKLLKKDKQPNKSKKIKTSRSSVSTDSSSSSDEQIPPIQLPRKIFSVAKDDKKIEKCNSIDLKHKVNETLIDDSEMPENSDQNSINSSIGKGRKNIREVMSQASLQKETILASQAETNRRKRIANMQQMYNHAFEVNDQQQKITKKLVLEMDPETRAELVEIHPDIVQKLKPHQVEGVKFMWECTIESLKQLGKTPGSGCILAHCMGLGKTLQVICFLHTVLKNKHTSKYLKTALIVCPCNTILNWYEEFQKWLDNKELKLNVFEMTNLKKNNLRSNYLETWHREGGVMLISYDMYRKLSQGEKLNKVSSEIKEVFLKTLLDPGADLVICDEGHMLKNDKSCISKAINQLKSLRRIVLTGTPLQNNLIEYHCMVNCVKRNLLGTRKEFLNRFVNPINNGQCIDSSIVDVKIMKKRVHVLHSMLEGFVQRYDYSSLATYLPTKLEYVLNIKLSEAQIKLYRCYLENFGPPDKEKNANAGSKLFSDFNVLRLVWTHPYILYNYVKEKLQKSNATITKFFPIKHVDESGNEIKDHKINLQNAMSDTNNKNYDIQIVTEGHQDDDYLGDAEDEEIPFYQNSLLRQMIEKEKSSDIWTSGKMIIFLDILQKCEEIGDKLLVFSQSLKTLNYIEEILITMQEESKNNPEQDYQFGSWRIGHDYFRLDGSINVEQRKKSIAKFNEEGNHRARLFLISTKAGSLGANMIGANRVILMDTSWNPSHDVQAIFRVYRFGQCKPVYVYRLIAHGTMEEKIYDRQVTKQSLSFRVVDDQQMERHFTFADLMDLYKFDPYKQSNRPTPMVPKDRLLAELLITHKDTISSYHEHDSLLQSANEDDLTEEERKAAWCEYETEKERLLRPPGKLKEMDLKALEIFPSTSSLHLNPKNYFNPFFI